MDFVDVCGELDMLDGNTAIGRRAQDDASERVARLLARTGARAARWCERTSGGRPQLTSSDIAATLAFVPDGIGRELLELKYLAGKSETKKVVNIVGKMIYAEWEWQERELLAAQYPAVNDAPGIDRTLAIARLQSLHAKRWPSMIERIDPFTTVGGYSLMVEAALDEFLNPKACPGCRGCGKSYDPGTDLDTLDQDARDCPQCRGTCLVPRSKAARGRTMSISDVAFAKNWAAPYEWVMRRLSDRLAQATDAFLRALKNPN